MLIKQIIEVFDLLDDSRVNGQKVKDFLLSIRPDTEIEVKPLKGPKGGGECPHNRPFGQTGRHRSKT